MSTSGRPASTSPALPRHWRIVDGEKHTSRQGETRFTIAGDRLDVALTAELRSLLLSVDDVDDAGGISTAELSAADCKWLGARLLARAVFIEATFGG